MNLDRSRLVFMLHVRLIVALVSGGLAGAQAFAVQAEGDASVYSPIVESVQMAGRWFGGPVYSSAVSDGYVFFGSGGAVRVLKVRGRRTGNVRWEEVGVIETPGIVRDMEARDDLLFLTDDEGALGLLPPRPAFFVVGCAEGVNDGVAVGCAVSLGSTCPPSGNRGCSGSGPVKTRSMPTSRDNKR